MKNLLIKIDWEDKIYTSDKQEEEIVDQGQVVERCCLNHCRHVLLSLSRFFLSLTLSVFFSPFLSRLGDWRTT